MTASHASPPASSGSTSQGWRPVPRSWLLTVVRLGRWRAEQRRQLRGGPFPVIGRRGVVPRHAPKVIRKRKRCEGKDVAEQSNEAGVDRFVEFAGSAVSNGSVSSPDGTRGGCSA